MRPASAKLCAIHVRAVGGSRSRGGGGGSSVAAPPLHRHRQDKTPAYPVLGSLSAAAYKRRCIFGIGPKLRRSLLYRCCFPPTRRFHSPHFRPLLPVPGPCGITRRRQGPPRTGSRMRKHQRLGKASAAACLPPEPNTCKSRMQCQIQFMQCQIQVFPGPVCASTP